jgi:hypothetical protein
MKTQKVAKIRRTRNSAQVGDTLIYEPQHPKIEDCEQWRVVYITQNNMAIAVLIKVFDKFSFINISKDYEVCFFKSHINTP